MPAETSTFETTTHYSGKRYRAPDEDSFRSELAEAQANIESLKLKLTEKQNACSNASSGKVEGNSQRGLLRAAFDELIQQRNIVNDKRQALLNELKSIQAGIRKKTDEMKSSRDKVGHKSVADIDASIINLESQLAGGRLSLMEEKNIVNSISSLKKSKKALEAMSGDATSLQEKKTRMEELRAAMDALDPERKEIKAKLDAAKAEMNAFEEARKEKQESVSDLYAAKNAAKQELDEAYSHMRELRADHKEQKDAFYAHMRSEKERRDREWKARKLEEREEAVAKKVLAEREAADIPAYTEEIHMVMNLHKFFEQLVDPSKMPEKVTAAAPAKSSLNVREVDSTLPDGVIPLGKKKDRDEEAFMMFSGKKSKKQKGAISAPSASKALKLDLATIEHLVNLKFDIPSKQDDLPALLIKLTEKLEYYKENQAKKTEENKAKAEAKIAALKIKNAEDLDGEDKGNEDKKDDTVTSTAA